MPTQEINKLCVFSLHGFLSHSAFAASYDNYYFQFTPEPCDGEMQIGAQRERERERESE